MGTRMIFMIMQEACVFLTKLALGVTAFAGLAYFGLLFGPVLIGGVAQVSTLPIGLSVVAACAALIALVGPRIMKQLKL